MDVLIFSDEIVKTFTAGSNLPTSFAVIKPNTSEASPTTRREEKRPALRSIEPPTGLKMKDCAIWYLGEEGRGLLNIQMTHADCPVSFFSTDAQNKF